MPKKSNNLDLRPLMANFRKAKKTLPPKLGNGAVKFFRENFRREGFLDRGVEKWKDRKYPARGRQKGLLKVSGQLFRGIKRLQTSFDYIKIGVKGVPYAEIHNTGGTTRPTVTPKMRGWARHQYNKTGLPVFKAIANTKKKSLTVEIPKRKYIGKSWTLERDLKKRIDKELFNFAKNV